MAKNIVTLNVNSADYSLRPYGTCDTAAGTAAKVVTCADFKLATGATILVKFTNANSVGSPTLNVNSTGAKNIYYRGAALTSSLYYWGAKDIVEFYYDGTQWNLLDVSNTNTTYSALKNPNALTIQRNGTTLDTYDGSAAKTINITDNDTHYTTGINAGASGATSNSAQSNPYVTVKDNSTYRSQIQLKGSGATKVSSDANGVITISSTDNNTTYSSKTAASGGTDVSLVTTGEKYTWNSKTSNTGTVTKVSTGKGLTGGDITTTGTIKCNLNSETSLGTIGSTSKLYAVGVDANNKLCVNVPWTDNNTTYSNATTSAAGLMSKDDKAKLDGIQSGADAVSFSRSLTSGTKIGTITINGTGTDLYCQTNTNTTYSAGNGLTLSSTTFNVGAGTGISVAADTVSVSSSLYTTASATTAATAGWYRIATSAASISNCSGIFHIVGAVSGKHTTAIVTAGISYGVANSANISVLQCSQYSSNALTKVRIVYHTTYDSKYAYLEVYNPNATALPITVKMLGGTGWSLVTPSTAGSVPSGYSNKEATLSDATIYSEKFSGNGSGLSSLNASNISSGTIGAARLPAATTSAQGAMTAAMVTKLNGIAEGANKYSLPLAASGTRGGIQLGYSASGANIPVAVSSEKAYVALTKTAVTTALGYTPPTTNTTYSTMGAATSSAAGTSGLVPAPAAGKQASFLRGDGTWVVPTNTTYSLVGAKDTTGLIKNGSSVTSTSGLTACPIISGIPYYKDTNTTYTLSSLGIGNVKNYDQSKAIKAITRSGTTFTYTCLDGTTGTFTQQDNNTTYSAATTSANGLMSSTDKSRLDYMHSSQAVTTLASLPAKAIVTATLSAATSISLASALTIGQSITVICTPSASFTQPIPTSGSFISMDGDSLKVTSGKKFEINILCYASSKYSISCKTAV